MNYSKSGAATAILQPWDQKPHAEDDITGEEKEPHSLNS